MRGHWRLLKMAFRVATWRATAEPPAVGARGLAAWVVVTIAFSVLVAYPTPDSHFSEYGLGLTIGELLLSLGATMLLLRPDNRVAAASALLVASLTTAAAFLVLLVAASLLFAYIDQPQLGQIATSVVMYSLYMIWLVGSYAAVLRSFGGYSHWRGWSRAGVVWAAQMAVWLMFPSYPAFPTKDSYDKPFNVWHYARSLASPTEDHPSEKPRRVDRARTELAQPALMDEAIDALKPQVRGETDVYAIGIAGSSMQGVFIKELDGALAAMDKVLPVRERTLRLVNHVDTADKTPVAIRANFAAAVRAVARKMDRDEDVLLLVMTSHGSPYGVALDLPGMVSADLAPKDVAEVLDREGIKNRIVIVSACYAGVFVKPLANDNTIVMTAADEEHTSFGCSNEREWTYFGDAFFNRNLRADVSIEEAFLDAKVTIGQWEARDGLTPSNPQGHFGPALMARLEPIYGTSRQADRAGPPEAPVATSSR